MPRRLHIMRSFWLTIGALIMLAASASAQGAPVAVLSVKGAVTPVFANYIQRGIEQAERRGDQALLIELDTPGGSVQIMTELVQTMTGARLPVIVYVTPTGAMAASAGTFIVLGAHVAAMAPGTTIGAASPVGMQGEDIGQTAEAKAKSVLAAQIRALASRRGEAAAAWAERTVRDADAATAQEALEVGVIDLVARDREELLAQLDGREVTVQGETRVLRTLNAETRTLPMSFTERVLHILTDPTIAYLLLILGINAFLIELSNPGVGFAGAFGGIALVLAFYSLGALNVNYAGLALIVLAFVLFAADIKVQSQGALVAGGLLAFVLGSAMLFNTAYASISWTLIFGTAAVTTLVFTVFVQLGWRSRSRPVVTGKEALIGRVGEVRTALGPEGQVFAWGSLWHAVSLGGPVAVGEKVRIERVDGLTVYVLPYPEPMRPRPPADAGAAPSSP